MSIFYLKMTLKKNKKLQLNKKNFSIAECARFIFNLFKRIRGGLRWRDQRGRE